MNRVDIWAITAFTNILCILSPWYKWPLPVAICHCHCNCDNQGGEMFMIIGTIITIRLARWLSYWLPTMLSCPTERRGRGLIYIAIGWLILFDWLRDWLIVDDWSLSNSDWSVRAHGVDFSKYLGSWRPLLVRHPLLAPCRVFQGDLKQQQQSHPEQ